MQIWLRCFSVSYGLQGKALAWHVKASMRSGLSLTIVHFSFDYSQVKFLIDLLSTVLPVYTFMHAILSTWNAIPPIPLGKLFLILQTLFRNHFYKIFPTLPDGSNSSLQSVVSGPVASTLSRNLLGIHILRPILETLRAEPSNQYFYKPTRWFWCTLTFKNNCFIYRF